MLNRAVPLGFAVARWLEKLRFCDTSQVKRRFCSQCVRAEVVKIIPNARKSYSFACLEESDESHFSWQAQHIVDLKIETGAGFRESETFASQLYWDLQFQSGVLEVLNRAVRLGFAMQSVCSEIRFCEKSRVKRSFWKLGSSLLVKVSWKMLVLEAWIVTVGESLV